MSNFNCERCGAPCVEGEVVLQQDEWTFIGRVR